MVQFTGPFTGFSFSANRYYTTAVTAEWFSVDNESKPYTDWVSLSGETGSSAQQVAFPDPSRTVSSYHASIGGGATFEAFIAEARHQSRANWRVAYTAAAVNDYLRQGFGVPLAASRAPRPQQISRVSGPGRSPSRPLTVLNVGGNLRGKPHRVLNVLGRSLVPAVRPAGGVYLLPQGVR
jgi:hypothetical protein